MRPYLSLILTVLLVLLVLIGLSAAGNVEFDASDESEAQPVRSTYNAGPTGTRALYQWLDESGYKVARWRKRFAELPRQAAQGTLVIVGPFPTLEGIDETEAEQLHEWVAAGGQLLVASPDPEEQFGADAMLEPVAARPSEETLPPPPPPAPTPAGSPGSIPLPTPTPANAAMPAINEASDALIVQPTTLTRGLHDLQLTRTAARLKLASSAAAAPAIKAATDSIEEARPAQTQPAEPPPPPPRPPILPRQQLQKLQLTEPATTPATTPESAPAANEPSADEAETDSAEPRPTETSAAETSLTLSAPVIHLGDQAGAVLADFTYGAGRVVFFSDPFAIANNGLPRGGNRQLALNLVRELSRPGQPIYFDEYHHGYRNEENALLRYFNGTPFWWVLGQLLVLGLLIVYSYGKRFARPLPVARTDRHSPLEFVGSMAHLQQTAQARDLAIENIYPRFKVRLCRRLGLPVKSSPTEIGVVLRKRRPFAVSADELELALQDSEYILAGTPITDERLVELVTTLRHVLAEMK